MSKKELMKEEVKEAKKELPAALEEVDALKYEKLQLQLQSLQIQAQNIELTRQTMQAQFQQFANELNAKYSLGPEDTVDLQTLKITRKG